MRRLRDERGVIGLLGLLAALVICLILVVMFVGPSGKKGPGKETIPGQAIEQGREVECQANLRTIRAAIDMQKTEDGAAPASINDIKTGTSNPDIFKCPVGGEAFVYDPVAGTIRCPHAGHEGF